MEGIRKRAAGISGEQDGAGKELPPGQDVPQGASFLGSGEVHCPYGSKGIDLIVSGITVQSMPHQNVQHILILKPVFHVHRMVNTFSGAQARFSFSDIVTNSEWCWRLSPSGSRRPRATAILPSRVRADGKRAVRPIHPQQQLPQEGSFLWRSTAVLFRGNWVASELFGYEEGAYTGQRRGQAG